MKKTWGKHLILDIHGLPKEKLQNKKEIEALLARIVEKFKMRMLKRPIVVKVASENYPHWGLSGFVMIYESHVSIHTWPEENYVAMDVYSCKNFNEKAVIKYLKSYWRCKEIKTRLAIRG